MKASKVLTGYDQSGKRNFHKKNLRGQSFEGKDLSGADFSEADIRETNFKNAILRGANFSKVEAGLRKRWVVILGITSWLISTVTGFFISFFSVVISAFLALDQISDKDDIPYNITALIVVIILIFLFIYIIREGIGRAVILAVILAVVADGLVAIPFAALRDINDASTLKPEYVVVTLVLAVVIIVVAFALVTARVIEKKMAIVVTLAVILALAEAVFGAVGFALTGYKDKILEGVIAGAGAVAIALVIAFALVVAGALTFGVVFTITGDRVEAGVGAVVLAIVCSLTGARIVAAIKILDVALVLFFTLLGAHLGRLSLGRNPREKWIRQAVIAFAAIGGTSFRHADLTEANFEGARLKSTDFREATLTRVLWHKVEMLDRVRPGDTYLKDAQVRQWLRGIETVDNNFDGRDLRGVNLKKANLADASLIRTDLSEADLSETTLTGACIQDWNINSQTKLDDVICDYVYLKKDEQERLPHDPKRKFKQGEFTKYIEKALNTVDLIFSDGIDWNAFLLSLKELQDEYGRKNIGVQAIERKSDGAFVVRVEVPPDANKGKIEKFFKHKYGLALKAKEEEYKKLLQAKDKDIAYFRQQNTNLLDIIKLQASKPINITQIQGNNMAGDRNIEIKQGNYNENIQGDYYEQSGNFGIGHMSGGTIEEGAKVAGVIHEGQAKNLAEVAAEIQDLLNYFQEHNPTITEAQQIVKTATERQPELQDVTIIEAAIKTTPTLKQRLKAAGEAAYLETVKILLPPLGVAIEAFKGWQNPE